MFKKMPNWYARLAMTCFFIGIFMIFPSMLIEALIFGIVEGYIVVPIVIVMFFPMIFSVAFKDVRETTTYENK